MSPFQKHLSPVRNLSVKGFFLATCLILLATLPTRGHVVSQIYAEWSAQDPWQMDLLFDAGYAVPEWRGDAQSPAPTRDWLLEIGEPRWTQLKLETERYLRESMQFQAAGSSLTWRIAFVDFEKTPPDFPTLLNDGAYFRIRIQGADPAAPRPTEITWNDQPRPTLVIKLPGTEANYLSLNPGQTLSLPSTSEKSKVGRAAWHESFRQGFLHVLPLGMDHVLFVLGLFFYQRSWRPLLAQSLAFTAAHTLTLGLAAAGIIPSPGPWIEPLIALSLAVIALENLLSRGKSPAKHRLTLVFGFGMIHGLGFAGALAAWLKPGEEFLKSLLSANLGVEAAQITLIAAAWIFTLRWHRTSTYQTLRKIACLCIASAGIWLLYQRLGSILA